MCAVCGCGNQASVTKGGHDAHHGEHEHEHVDAEGHVLRHRHDDGHAARLVKVERDLFEKNDRVAALNRAAFARSRTLALNLVSSPGAGKTTLLVRTLGELRAHHALAVIEGDQQTRIDAARIEATGVAALQINTGKMCHLDAKMIGDALTTLPPPEKGLLFIENVGNLVCPAGFDLGESAKIVLCSVTEGEDKPLKYPDMFHAASLVLVTKIDLLPHLELDVEVLVENARKVNPDAPVLRVSAQTGEGLGAYYSWLEARRQQEGRT